MSETDQLEDEATLDETASQHEETASDSGETVSDSEETPAESGETASENEEPARRRGWTTWFRGRRLVALVLVLVIVALGVAAGLLYRQHLSTEAVDSARSAALDSAKRKAPQVLSYDHRTWDQNLATAKADLTGTFQQDFETLATQLVGPTAKAKSVVTTASVSAASVIRGDENQVVALLFIDQQTQSTEQQGTQVSSSRVRVTLDDVNGNWLISNMEPI